MNVEKELILINNEDKTDNIISCRFKDDRYNVVYKDDDETYKYYFTAVKWLQNPVQLNILEIDLPDDVRISEVRKILSFQGYRKIFFEGGRTEVYSQDNVMLKKKYPSAIKLSDCLEYLKEISNIVGVLDDENISLLSKQYNRMNVINSESILPLYLKAKPPERLNESDNIQPIFPFGFNLSQKVATQKALGERVSIIEGPPGTGKTQTILNIIANAVINGKTVAVVSNNNLAALNIAEKLEKQGLSFITAYLGSNSNKEAFFENQTGKYPDMSEWGMSSDDINNTKEKLVSLGKRLDEILEIKNISANLEKEKNDYITEKKHFDIYYKEKYNEIISHKSKHKFDSDKLMNMIIEYQNIIEQSKKITFINKIKWLIRYGIFNFKFYNNSHDSIVALFEKKYFEQKIEELQKKILKLYPEYEEYSFKANMREYTKLSMKLFKAHLYSRYNKSEREIFCKTHLVNDTDNFTKEYPVILSTTHSLRHSLKPNYVYDYVIVDESSQVDIVTGALTFSCAKNVVIVGDLKQLPNVVPEYIKKITDDIYNKYNLNTAYMYSDNSLLSSISKLYNDVPRTLLKEHYRCHPMIIGYCNKKFYNNELIILSERRDALEPLRVYKTVKGNHARGRLNQREIDVIFDEILTDESICTDKNSIGIISPYKDQANELKKLISKENIEIDTVHKFQGREKDIVIISTVSNKINDFIDKPDLINVAVSRAINKLILVVSGNDEESKNTNIGDLLKYIEYNNCTLNESKVNSVFDLLYTCYSNKLIEFYKKAKKVSKYDSENIVNFLIEEVLSNPQFSSLGKVMNQPLQKLIKDTSKLTEEEYKFVMNILTHTDFLIFNKLSKEPILVIEVDGYKYHDNNKKQLERDSMKDEILNKYNIPILRLKTNGSNEKDRLYSKLTEVLNK